MNRNLEAILVAVAAVVAGFGVGLVNLASGGWFDAQVVLTVIAFGAAFGSMHLAARAWIPNANPYVLPLAAFLTAIGFIEIYRVDAGLANLQRWSLEIGALTAVAVLFWLRNEGVVVLRRYRYLFLLGGVVLLLLPLLPDSLPLHGVEVNGSRLWVRFRIPIGGRTLSFQPGEIAKLALTIFLASYLAERHEALATIERRWRRIRIPEPRQLGPLLVAWLAAFGVLIYQRDLGASLLLFGLFVGMLYIATGRATYVATGGLLVAVGGVVAASTFDHVARRVESWLRPFDDFTGAGYQVAQALFALGSGSLTGSGIGLGRPDLIPAAATDFIFAAVAEEMGLAGSIAVLTAYALFITAGFGIALRSRDLFRKFLGAGLTLVFGLQSILIIAGVLRLFPVTGITLPFMSYGGSSLLANLVLVALLMRISHGERA